jgi:antitoxin (DNA-binding transcriptional repressor) of toxin-antitoxin stability system
MDMKAVGIKNLKNNLSKYLDMVREGEVVYVTDRDDIIAEIHKPVSAPTTMLSRWDAYLNEEERKGTIIRAKRERASSIEGWKKLQPLPPGGPTTQELLDDMRADRF